MKIVFDEHAWRDYLHWQKHDKRQLRRINELIRDISRDDPYTGLGKPEPLRHDLTGWWSRRIDQEHRLVYRVSEIENETKAIWIAQCRYHY